MKLRKTPELLAFLSTYFSDSDADADERATRDFLSAAPSGRQEQVIAQA